MKGAEDEAADQGRDRIGSRSLSPPKSIPRKQTSSLTGAATTISSELDREAPERFRDVFLFGFPDQI